MCERAFRHHARSDPFFHPPRSVLTRQCWLCGRKGRRIAIEDSSSRLHYIVHQVHVRGNEGVVERHDENQQGHADEERQQSLEDRSPGEQMHIVSHDGL